MMLGGWGSVGADFDLIKGPKILTLACCSSWCVFIPDKHATTVRNSLKSFICAGAVSSAVMWVFHGLYHQNNYILPPLYTRPHVNPVLKILVYA